MPTRTRTHRRRQSPPTRVAFKGAENDDLFLPYLTKTDDGFSAAIYRSLLDKAPAATTAVKGLVKAGCPRIPLCDRLFAVALGYVHLYRPRTSLLGGYDGKTLKRLARKTDNLGVELDRATKALFGPSTASIWLSGERHARMMRVPGILREFATDLRDEHVLRLKEVLAPEPNLMPMYFTGLCDFVYEHTERDFYGLLGGLVESIVNLYLVSEDSRRQTDDPPERNQFSADAVRQMVKRFRRSVPQGPPAG